MTARVDQTSTSVEMENALTWIRDVMQLRIASMDPMRKLVVSDCFSVNYSWLMAD